MVAPSAFLSLLIASKTSLALAQKTWPSSLEFLAKGSDEEYKDFVTPLAQMTKCLGMRHGESWGQTAEQGLRSLQTPDDHSFRMFSCSSFFMVLVHAGLKLKQWIATMPAAPKQVASLANLSFPCPRICLDPPIAATRLTYTATWGSYYREKDENETIAGWLRGKLQSNPLVGMRALTFFEPPSMQESSSA